MDTGREGYKLITETVKKGQYAEAVALCEDFLQKNGDHFNAWLTRGRCEQQLQQFGNAIESFET